MDAIRRLSEGRLGELTGTGCGARPTCRSGSSPTPSASTPGCSTTSASAGSRRSAGYAAGVEQRIEQVRANPSLLPGEYVLLSTQPANWTVDDTMAAGVFLTRNIASQGGNEMANVAMLRQLEQKYGDGERRAIFHELFPDDEPNAAVTIPGRAFSQPAGGRPLPRRPGARCAAAR